MACFSVVCGGQSAQFTLQKKHSLQTLVLELPDCLKTQSLEKPGDKKNPGFTA